MKKRLEQLWTYLKLGPESIVRVVLYRLAIKFGVHPAQRLSAPIAVGPFFRAVSQESKLPAPNVNWDDKLNWFGWYGEPLPPGSPDWFYNPFSDNPQPDASHDWWKVPDFGAGDIKGLWELSRFDWVVAWATKAAHGDLLALERLNHWLLDWAGKNPPYKGPNWKCGQEASIRVMHIVIAAWMLKQADDPEPGLVDLLVTHLRRIAPTMSYAIGQQNNHGTSEAAALFIGGSFLSGKDDRADAWAKKGRYWLENRAAALIEPDGSFSQYSVNYHRVMLDTYSLSEAWRKDLGLPEFSDRLMSRLAKAADWLFCLTDPVTGDAPNIGANDGARLIQLTGSDYRDFRPSVHLGAALFCNANAFGSGPWEVPLRWLKVPDGHALMRASSNSFDCGGYHVLRRAKAVVVMRYPRFRFRPSQADALHVDLWHGGVNILRDAGTFSYNAEGSEWFAGTAAHNTIEFDGRDQMSRLGRFLFSNWLRAENVEVATDDGSSVAASAAYTDDHGARHHRRISLDSDYLLCEDSVSGEFNEAICRWRLTPGNWRLDDSVLRNGGQAISIEIDGLPVVPSVGSAEESRYYGCKSEVTAVSVRVNRAAKIITKVEF